MSRVQMLCPVFLRDETAVDLIVDFPHSIALRGELNSEEEETQCPCIISSRPRRL